MTTAQRESYEERAAIMEIDGEMTLERAERNAWFLTFCQHCPDRTDVCAIQRADPCRQPRG